MQFPSSFMRKIALWQWSHLQPFSDVDFLNPFLVPLWLPFGTRLAPHATLLASIGFLLVSFCIRFDSLRLLLELWASLYPPWSCILSAFPTSVAPSCTKMGFGAHSSAKQLQSTAIFSHTWYFCGVELDVLATPNFLKIYLAAANFAKHLDSIDRNLHRRNSSFAERLTHLARCGILPQAT